MDILQDWIGPRIHQAFTEALEWKARGSPASCDGRDGDFEDDGNSLRVKSSKKEYVQITKIENVARPVQLWLSDKWTQLKVVIAAEATERFEREERRRVTEETLGAVIQIIDYEIVAQHHGPKRTKITMLIKNFKHIGSDGSSLFGAPRPIECLEPIVDLLAKLQMLRAREHLTSQSPASFKMARDFVPSSSQTTSISSVDDNIDRSQEVFATQVPRLQSRKRTREGSLKPNGKQPSNRNGLNSGSPRAMVESGIERERALGADTAQACEVEILPLIDNRQQGSSNFLDNFSKVTAESNNDGPVAKRDMIREANVATPQELKDKKTNDLLSLLTNTKPNKVQRRAAENSAEKAHNNSQEPTSLPAVTLKDISPIDKEPQNQTTHEITESSGQEPKNPRSPIRSLQYPVGIRRVMKPVRKASIAAIDSYSVARQLRKTHARICGSEVRVPRNQRDLLDRNDSWYPPEPGQRAPTANVPITILQELNDRAERQANLPQESLQASIASESPRRDRSSQTSSEFEEKRDQSSDLDEPIPSAEWPTSSPEPNQLPPDSSLNSVRSLGRIASKQDHSSKSDPKNTYFKDDAHRVERRQSTISLSSHSDMSQPRNLPRKAKFKSCSTEQTTDALVSQRRNPSRSARPSPSKWSSNDRSPSLSSDEAEDGLAYITSEKMTSHFLHDHVTTAVSQESPNIFTEYASPRNQQISSKSKFERTRQEMLANSQSPVPHRDSFRIETEKDPLKSGVEDELQNDYLNDPAFQGEPLRLGYHSSLNEGNTHISPASSKLMDHSVVAHQSSKTKSPKVSSPESGSNEEMQTEIRIPSQSKIDHSDSDSDIQISVPHPLNDANNISSLYSTQPNKPILQVNRTPYAANHSLKLNSYNTSNMLSNSTISQAYRPQAVDVGLNSEPANTTGLANPAQPRLVEDISARKTVSSTDQQISCIEESIQLPLATSVLPSKAMPAPRLEALKRKASTPITLSSNVTKRRKGFGHGWSLAESKTSTHNFNSRDINRRERDEFFARRKLLTAPNDDAEGASVRGEDNRDCASEDASQSLADGISVDQCLPAQSEESQVSPQVSTERHLEQQHTSVANEASRTSDGPDRMQLHLDETPSSLLPTHTTPLRTQNGPLTKEAIDETRFGQSSKAIPLYPKDEVSIKPNNEVPEIEFEIHDRLPLVQVSSTAYLPEEQRASPSIPAVADATATWPPTSDTSRERKPNPTNDEEAQQGVMKANAALGIIQPAPAEVPESDTIDPTERDPHPSQEALLENAESRPPTRPLSVFDRFKTTYPDYPGNQAQFGAICKRIGLLLRSDRMEHPSLWDDFIVRHRVEYAQYLSQCNDEAEDPIPYERFYRNKVSQAKYISPDGLVVTPDSISEFLPPEDQEHTISKEKKEKETSRQKDILLTNGDSHVHRSTEIYQSSSPETSVTAGRAMDGDDMRSVKESVNPRFQQADNHGRTIKTSDSNVTREQTKPQRKAGSGFMRSESQSTTLSSRTNKTRESSNISKDRQKLVIDLTSDLEQQPVSRSPNLSQNPSLVKPSRRSLPWISPSRGKTASVDHRLDIRSAISTPNPSGLHHRHATSTMPSKVASAKPTSVFAEFSQKSPHTDAKSAIPPPSTLENTASIATATPKPASVRKPLDKPAKSSDQSGWAEDEHGPYRAFTKRYEAITPGKGNSFAKEQGQDIGAVKRSAPKWKPVNPFNFEL